MELREAHRTIDATAGFLMHLQALDNANLLVTEDEEKGLGILEAKVYTTINTPNPERRCKFKYQNGEDVEFIIPQIAPVCDFIIDNWPSPSAKKLRSHIDESNVLYLADEILGLNDPMMYETVPEAYEYQALFRNGPTKLLDEIYDINYRLAYALRMTDEGETNEDESDDIISSSDELIIKAIEIMNEEKVLKNLYDFAFIMDIILLNGRRGIFGTLFNHREGVHLKIGTPSRIVYMMVCLALLSLNRNLFTVNDVETLLQLRIEN